MKPEPTNAEILQAIRNYHAGRGPKPHEVLAGKYTEAEVRAKMKRMADGCILEYEDDILEARITGETNG